MKELKSILIVDDNKETVAALAEGFRFLESAKDLPYVFEVKTAISVEDLLAQGLDKQAHDINIIDLQLNPGKGLFGFKIVEAIAIQSPGSLMVVYSAFPQVENITKSMSLGATAFFSKAEWAPHELVPKIVALLNQHNEKSRERRHLELLLQQKYAEWQQKYSGQVVVVVDGEVVASDPRRLRALLDYQRLRDRHPDWPDDPLILEISQDKGE